MPITQDRMITIIEEALALREYTLRYKAIVEDMIDTIKNSPQEDWHNLMREFKVELYQVPFPEIMHIMLEQVHFKKAYRYNEREKMRLRSKKHLEGYKYGPKARTRQNERGPASNELGKVEFEFDPKTQAAADPSIVTEDMFGSPAETYGASEVKPDDIIGHALEHLTPEELAEDQALMEKMARAGSPATTSPAIPSPGEKDKTK